MNGAQRETSSPGTGPNGEDLDVVLGRFQNWAKTRRQIPAPGLGNKLGGYQNANSANSSIAKRTEEAQEVSYEHALRASRYRRPVDLAELDPPTKTSDAEKETGAKRDRKASSSARKSTPLEMRPVENRWPKVQFPAKAPMTQPRAEPKATSVSVDRPPCPTPMKTTSMPASQREAQRQNPPANSGIGTSISSTPAKGRKVPPLQQASAAAYKPKPIRSAGSESRRNPPAFCDVLKGTAALVAGTLVVGSQDAPAALESAKVSCLTLRVSDTEQARIQACAAQANLSVSAYLRQCALGVDELRSQVEIALAKLREPPVPAHAQPGVAAIPGILKRFVQQCFRWRKSSQQSISLMAS
jgi:hypothetical protein